MPGNGFNISAEDIKKHQAQAELTQNDLSRDKSETFGSKLIAAVKLFDESFGEQFYNSVVK